MRKEELTLKNLMELNLYPELSNFLERELVSSYEGFISVLYKELDSIIQTLQKNRELRQKDGEDRLTLDIVNLLSQAGYNASHETKIGGHVDIIVNFRKFIWFGEAKIHSSYPYLLKGFKQLCTRYTTGDINQDNGGILIYIKKQKNASEIMKRWGQYLSDQNLDGYSSTPCPIRPLAFFSTHVHDVSGTPFKIRHMPVLLHFDPQDRS